MNGVAATPGGTLWAVGYCSPTSSTKHTLIERWDGATWQVVASPNSSAAENILSAVAAVSSANAWAVGLVNGPWPLTGHPLIEQWDGRNWRVVPVPAVEGYLTAVTALSGTDIWAVGEFALGTHHPGELLIEHWDGSHWSLVPTTNPQANRESLRGIAAVSARDMWAVGSHDASALIEHWDGARWSVVASPSAGAGLSSLTGLGLVSASDIWSVGEVDVSNALARAFSEHWNGTAWSLIPLGA